jgi:hypothetical protein
MPGLSGGSLGMRTLSSSLLYHTKGKQLVAFQQHAILPSGVLGCRSSTARRVAMASGCSTGKKPRSEWVAVPILP